MHQSAALLDNQEARAADQFTIDSGISGETLMENAGKAVTDIITQHFKPSPVLILCGGGNNGGDGFVVARLLKEKNWPVTVCLLSDMDESKADATSALHKWGAAGGRNTPFYADLLNQHTIVVDAIFGTGLDREVAGPIYDVISDVNNSPLPVISIDIASGINGDTGEVLGVAMEAMHTVSFTYPKPGHFLLPGKINTGHLHVSDIGIASKDITPSQFLNVPNLWQNQFSKLVPNPDSHKYTRGHTLVVGGNIESTGASKLASLSSLRIGSGLVSIACTKDTLPVYASSLLSVMTKLYSKPQDLASVIDSNKITGIAIGPGCGVSKNTQDLTVQALNSQKPCVIDADAISAFQDNPSSLFLAIEGPTVLTPHEGEFNRIFNVKGAKTKRAIEAAKKCGAVVVLKGNDTVIAAPDGRVAINCNAPVWLATAGSGDVLAGLISGLMAQSIPPFEAACMGTWIHSEAASQYGPGLISEDLPAAIPEVLRKLYYD